MDRFQGKVVVVTGGSRGIGRATIQRLHDEGASVATMARNENTLRDLQTEIGGDIFVATGDVTVQNDLDNFFAEAHRQLGEFDALIVNAAAQRLLKFENATEADFDDVIAVVLKSVYFTVQRALPHLATPSSVVLLSSTAAHHGLPFNTAYQAAKAGVRSLARGLSAELHDRGIRVNALSPGQTNSDMGNANPVRHTAVDPEDFTLLADLAWRRIRIGRLAEAKEIAAGATFLASEDSSYMLGAELVIDGGAEQL